MTCTCGTPSLANYHVFVIVAPIDPLADEHHEVTHNDLYVCAEHMLPDDLHTTIGLSPSWEILESKVTELR